MEVSGKLQNFILSGFSTARPLDQPVLDLNIYRHLLEAEVFVVAMSHHEGMDMIYILIVPVCVET